MFTSPEIKPPREDIRDGVERNIRTTLKNAPPEKLDIGEIQDADKENFHKLTNKLPESTKEKLYKAIDLYRSASQEIKNHATNNPIIRELGRKGPTNNRGKTNEIYQLLYKLLSIGVV